MRTKKARKCCNFPLPLLLQLLLPLSAHARQSPDHDILHYNIAIRVSDSTDAIAGRTELKVKTVQPASHIFLNLYGLDIDRVLMDNKGVVFNQKEHGVTIQYPNIIEAGETLRIAIDYNGVPEDGLSIKKNKYGRRAFFADNWPNRARYWFPGVDHPSDKASVEFHVTAPAKYSVVANGRLLRRTNNLNGTQTTSYSEPVAIPTYCMVFGAAEFDVVESGTFAGKQLSLWVFPQDIEDALNDFNRAGDMVEYFSRRFGSFPFAKLANVQSSTRFGGMENAGSIFYAEKSIGTERNIEGTVAHEIVHQWFGDHITETEWSHLWLSEGFATYFGTQYFEYTDGIDRFRNLMAQRRAGYLKQAALHTHAIVEDEPEDLFKLLNGNNYTKGGWVLHILRSQIGDEAFWRGIRLYADRFAGRNALTKDFQEAIEETSGESLGWFFEQWIFKPGIPELAIRYTWQEQSKKVKIELVQKQKQTMRFPLKILFKSNTDHVENFW
ncbi:MAG: M1 family metallopeptidase, partial [bacterium]